MEKVIIDSDWGGDVLQLTSVLAARPEDYEILGATVTFGNASLQQNVLNAGSMLRLMHMDKRIPYFAGAAAPSDFETPPAGDCAHGTTGLGYAVVPYSTVLPQKQSAVDFILQKLQGEATKTITLIATAPLTNVAEAIRRAPKTMDRLKEIRIMGGCTEPLIGYRVDPQNNRLSDTPIQRWGNITEFGEFNFQQAPHDAQTVMESGIQLALFPMNCTHQMTLTPKRRVKLETAFSDSPELLKQLIDLFTGPQQIDERKFGISPTLHDAHTTLSMIKPDLYQGRHGKVSITVDPKSPKHGLSQFSATDQGPHWVADKIKDSEAAFDLLLSALTKVLRLKAEYKDNEAN